MITLGIDTSCDDTSIALVSGHDILCNLVSSHLIHSDYGGVVPEFASRTHTRLLYPMLRLAVKTTGIPLSKIDLVAATNGPGLLGALLCGLAFAKGIAQGTGISFRAVNHMEGHIMSLRLSHPSLRPPFLALLVSGGHTELILAEKEFSYIELGSTLDDACGEAIDKVGKLMGLGYPAGPRVEKLALKANIPIKLPRPNPRDLEFSYSGLKTAARNYLAAHPETPKADVAAGLQEAAFDHLRDRVKRAIQAYKLTKVGIAGGVARNMTLRRKLKELGKITGFDLYVPRDELCTDNAAMVASAGAARFTKEGASALDCGAFDRAPLGVRAA
ncbi:tRNA (adenosine(37)-N6)-threonylcarbamoyltransferase complex transferase subunit TsaD [candidate division WOR-3 bacterium]|uniref:tRNA N6-adenosine threonylcarbamoyltransferase n=1 Tax=candidate division WOR-3 bacterium TaxID=2052148 RepID=A0A9D5K9C1_UNCW3|nr:tRNA (adenosine(37)-N6)-threonylcarbamoyltransferase complex transferase subunit TsaD [candidate division WOR-3 bacterium]MBD3363964.1 tRNA (adenosine(37)-N6)-threonylcarbamoyltransferase complex transferase subunit TsaD [candidate division WOR-3 bacterium]